MSWQFLQYLGSTQNTLTNKWFASSIINNGAEQERVICKFNYEPTSGEVYNYVSTTVESKNELPVSIISLNEVIVGSGVPSTVVMNGQYYLDSNTFDLYQCVGGIW